MATFLQHIAKARSNLQLATFLDSSGRTFFDWVIAAYFYAALHHVEAYFDLVHRSHYRKHGDRSRAISNDPRLTTGYNHYRRLQTYSETARYGARSFDRTYIQQRAFPHFTKLRQLIESIDPSLKI